jgi:hypothetical protein
MLFAWCLHFSSSRCGDAGQLTIAIIISRIYLPLTYGGSVLKAVASEVPEYTGAPILKTE